MAQNAIIANLNSNRKKIIRQIVKNRSILQQIRKELEPSPSMYKYNVIDETQGTIEITGLVNYPFTGSTLDFTVDNPSGGTYKTVSITGTDFQNITQQLTLSFPSSLTSIGANVFQGCNMSQIDVSSVTSLGEGAFYNCTFLKSVILKPNTAITSSKVFSGCTSLSVVTNLATIPLLGDNVFASTKLSSEITLSAISIGNSCFSSSKTLPRLLYASA